MAPRHQPRLSKLMELLDRTGLGFQRIKHLENEIEEVKAMLQLSGSEAESSEEEKPDSDDGEEKQNLMAGPIPVAADADADTENDLVVRLWVRLWVSKEELKLAKTDYDDVQISIHRLGVELANFQSHVVSERLEVLAVKYLMDNYDFTGDIRIHPLVTGENREALRDELSANGVPFSDD